MGGKPTLKGKLHANVRSSTEYKLNSIIAGFWRVFVIIVCIVICQAFLILSSICLFMSLFTLQVICVYMVASSSVFIWDS